MSEPTYKELSIVPPEKATVEAVGVRVLGVSDPRLLTREEFEKSPDLLFHGTHRVMQFSSEHDYQSDDYLAECDSSATLGFGFYTTDNRAEASNYSVVRQQTGTEAEPIVVSILPHEARVLDLRRKDVLTENASVPREIAMKWKNLFLRYLHIRPPREGNLGAKLNSLEQEYAQYLDKVLALDEIDLRVLLGTRPSKQAGNMNLHSPPWGASLFPNFLQEEGFDGLVYNEGGEGLSGKGGASFVFFNLKKIGTYESWHKQK